MTEPDDTSQHRAKYLPDAKAERRGMALCLSGGGYRAALFHLGALRRLNELGILAKVDTISGVSGGSILAAFLAQHLRPWPRDGAIADWDHAIAGKFREFTCKNIRTLWFLRRLLKPWDSTVAVEGLVRRYEKDIVQLRLNELPADGEGPRFIFSATDMAFGVNWVSERQRVGSYQAGYAEPPPDWPVARAVAASSCFPPAFDPMPIRLDPTSLAGGNAPLGPERGALIAGLRLSDGGLYDNMALEPVWKDHRVVLVSDGGATFDFTPDAGTFRRVGRYQAIQGKQAGAIRKRWLISNLTRGELDGTYWGIGSATSSYCRKIPGYTERLVDEVISEIRTDLDHFSEPEAAVLQNHGYQLADAAIRTHGDRWWTGPITKGRAPFPDWLDNEPEIRRALASSHKRKIIGRWREPRQP